MNEEVLRIRGKGIECEQEVFENSSKLWAWNAKYSAQLSEEITVVLLGAVLKIFSSYRLSV